MLSRAFVRKDNIRGGVRHDDIFSRTAYRVLIHKGRGILQRKEYWCCQLDHVVEESTLAALVPQVRHGCGHGDEMVSAIFGPPVLVADLQDANTPVS